MTASKLKLLRMLTLATLATGATVLSGCGSGTGYGGGGGNMMSSAAPSKLFAADSTDQVIGSLADRDPAAGSLAIDRAFGRVAPYFFNYAMLSTNLGSLALDATRDYLYVGNGTSILVFHSASQANGDIFANASFGTIGNTGSMFLDAANDRLYVGDDLNNVKVYSPASTASGSTPSPRLVTGTATPIHGLAVDTANDILYVSDDNAGAHQIEVFDGASSVTTAAPNRTITPTSVMVNLAVGGIALDQAHDALYVAPGSGGNGIMVLSGASTADGATAPAKTLTIAAAPGILNVVLDAVNDRLYAIGSNGHVYLVEAVSTLADGTVSAKDASVSGGSLTAIAVNPN